MPCSLYGMERTMVEPAAEVALTALEKQGYGGFSEVRAGPW